MQAGAIRSIYFSLNLADKMSASLKRAEKIIDQTKNKMELLDKSTKSSEQAISAFAAMMDRADKIQRDVTRVASIQNAQLRKLADAYVKAKWKVEKYSIAVKSAMQRAEGYIKSHAEDLRNVGLAASAAIGGIMWRTEKYESALAKLRALTKDNREEYEYYLKIIEKLNRVKLFSKSDIANMLAYAKANRLTREELEQLLPYVVSGAAIYREDLTTALMAMVRAMKYGEAELAERIGLQLRENAVMEESMKLYGKRLSQLTAEQKQRVIMLAIQNQYADIVGRENEILGENITKLTQAKIALDDAAVTIGTYLLPPLAKAAATFANLLKWLDDKPILGSGVAYGLLGTALIGIGSYAAVQAGTAIRTVAVTLGRYFIPASIKAAYTTGGLTAALRAAAIAFKGFAVALLTNPITWAIVGIVGAVLLLQHAWVHNWFGIRDKTAAAINFIRSKIDWLISGIRTLISWITALPSRIQEAWKAITENPIFKAAQLAFQFTPAGISLTAARTAYTAITEHKLTLPKLPAIPSTIPAHQTVHMGGVRADVNINLNDVKLDHTGRVKQLGIEISKQIEEGMAKALRRQKLAMG